jgi:hypothetical protein
MTRLQSLIVGGATAALVLGGTASTSFAAETDNFTNHLQGGSIGVPGGAAAPPGLYSGYIQLVVPQGPLRLEGNQGSAFVDTTLGAIPIVWSTGWNVLGASYSVAIAQAFYMGATVPQGLGPNSLAFNAAGTAQFATIANTGFTPINLSWNLHNGFFVSAGFNFAAPDGTIVPGNPNPDYWTFEPTLALSYIDKSWVLSANMYYDINTASQGRSMGLAGTAAGNGFVSGNVFYADLTAAYKFGKWELGPAAIINEQTTVDRPGGGISCAALNVATGGLGCGNQQEIGLGGIVGYDFGPVDLHVWAIEDIGCGGITNNVGCGLRVFGSIAFRIWGPEAPKPLVAKN